MHESPPLPLPSLSSRAESPLSVRETLRGKRLVVVGGTGFLGKVWLSLVLSRFPDLGHIYLFVRPKAGLDVEKRFREQILTSEVFLHLRKEHGAGFDDFIRSKVTPIAGDVSMPLAGTDAVLRESLRGKIAAVVNVAGIVDFDPPLDEALEVNAFGCQNLVAFARDLGGAAVLHTSTCFTAGSRTGPIEELDPREIPFPRAGELDVAKWSPEREIAECLDVIEQARHRANDGFRQSHFVDEAKKNLRERSEPLDGPVFDEELAKVRRKFVESQLSGLGMERARYWGWPNTYTYTKSMGEQIVASSGLPFCIVRPAIVESTLAFPFPGWNEGINTSSPFIFLIRQGGLQVPGSNNNLDLIPCDLVCVAITLALSELIEGRAKPVYQAASSDRNPATMARFFELSGLHKRKLYQRTGKGGPLLSRLQSRYESALLNKEEYEAYGPKKLASGAALLGEGLKKVGGPLAVLTRPLAAELSSFALQQKKLARVMDTFLPFVAEYHYIFMTDAVRGAYGRLADAEKELLPWRPEEIDWRHWFLEIHAPALERLVFPEMERRLRKKKPLSRAHTSLTSLLRNVSERYEHKVALGRLEGSGIATLSYLELFERAKGVAANLGARGIQRGDRVMLSGKNHPAWPVAFFGILLAGATVVPVDPGTSEDVFETLARASGAKLLILDADVQRHLGDGFTLSRWALNETLRATSREEAPAHEAAADDLACLIYTSGTTGSPKGVMLSHGNLTALVAALSPLFPLDTGDRLLSVLPLHHTFELTAGLLLPLSRGARITYLDELSSERLASGLKESRATALIGVPALWDALARRIEERAEERGPVLERAFSIGLEVSRLIGKKTGLDVGRALFGSVHAELGGHLRYLVSGGAALPEETHALFQGLGLHLAEGYGLTEAAPVLTVAKGGPTAKAGHVGYAVPGVELRIQQPNEQGIGEVLARGPNVMLGYEGNEEATRAVLDEDGWLHTGDLGKLDGRGRLVLVGRAKDVVISANGENLYPDDIEARLGTISEVSEVSVLGISDGKRGERLVAAIVPSESNLPREERHANALSRFETAVETLPVSQRPVRVFVLDEKLPRTSTRKVKRGELRKLLEQKESEASASHLPEAGGALDEMVRGLIAKIARRAVNDVKARTSFRADLGFDSLMAMELVTALERAVGQPLDAEKLTAATTVQELSSRLSGLTKARAKSQTSFIEGNSEEESVDLPQPLRALGKDVISVGQKSFYEVLMRTKVTGRVHIPQNRRTLVVANHTSHLDMGLVRHALGTYGEELRTLAAQDYFFEGHPLKKTIIEQFTNLVPMSRSGSLRAALRQSGELLDQGHTVLLFPEGTRSSDGSLLEFKPTVGYLALRHQVDVLPIWLEGAFGAFPRGAMVPRSRDLEARIGPPLPAAELAAMTKGLSAIDAARVAAKIVRLAVAALSRKESFQLENLDMESLRRSTLPAVEGLEGVFDELKERFVPQVAEAPVTYYFSLGEERWTVRATSEALEVSRGKTSEEADCVLKTTPLLFERIVREAYVPGPAEFMSGQLKTNNVALLVMMQKLFQLSRKSSDFLSDREDSL